METYVYPKIGGSGIAGISRRDIVAIFDQPHNGSTVPIREAIPETASSVRQRIEQVFSYAKNMGWCSGDNPATKDVLPKRSKKASLVNHHAAMKYDELPAFMNQLADAKDVAAMALRFLILTAARTGEVITATWSEIDLHNGTWCIPAAKTRDGN